MPHTPGPWHLEAGRYIAAGPVASPGEIGSGPLIADVFPHPGVPCRIPDASEQAANAALLIAAPHLLEVVRAVAMYFGDSKGRMGSPLGEAAKAALAKAGVSC